MSSLQSYSLCRVSCRLYSLIICVNQLYLFQTASHFSLHHAVLKYYQIFILFSKSISYSFQPDSSLPTWSFPPNLIFPSPTLSFPPNLVLPSQPDPSLPTWSFPPNPILPSQPDPSFQTWSFPPNLILPYQPVTWSFPPKLILSSQPDPYLLTWSLPPNLMLPSKPTPISPPLLGPSCRNQQRNTF